MPFSFYARCPVSCFWRNLAGSIALCIHVPAAIAQQTSTSFEYQTVNVDGYNKRIQVAGLANRRAGTPIVVLEAGLTNSLDVWGDVLPEVARFAPVVAYDRAGLGHSEWDDQTPTPEHVARTLRKLLLQAGAEPPYLLVGYSWGGVLTRYYSGYYPGDVAAIVYVDPGPIITHSVAHEVAPFDSIGAGKAGFDAFWAGFEAVLERASTATKAEFRVMRDLMKQDKGERDLKIPPDVPVAVILSAKPYRFFLNVPYDQQAHFDVDVRHRIRLLQEWALSSPNGTLVVSNNTTHAIPKEEPGLIVWAIKRLYDANR